MPVHTNCRMLNEFWKPGYRIPGWNDIRDNAWLAMIHVGVLSGVLV